MIQIQLVRGQIILTNWWDVFCGRGNQNNKNPLVRLHLQIDRSRHLLDQIQKQTLHSTL